MSDPSNPQGGWQQPPPPQPGWPAAPPPGGVSYGGYSQPAYGGGLREHPDGTTVLVLGILSLVVCGLIGPFAWSKGNRALAQIDAAPGVYSNRGSVSAGRICGIIASAILVLSLVFVVLAIVLGALSSASSS